VLVGIRAALLYLVGRLYLGISEQEFHILLIKYFDAHIYMYHTLQINFATEVNTELHLQLCTYQVDTALYMGQRNSVSCNSFCPGSNVTYLPVGYCIMQRIEQPYFALQCTNHWCWLDRELFHHTGP
jgi:hypothetical protein